MIWWWIIFWCGIFFVLYSTVVRGQILIVLSTSLLMMIDQSKNRYFSPIFRSISSNFEWLESLLSGQSISINFVITAEKLQFWLLNQFFSFLTEISLKNYWSCYVGYKIFFQKEKLPTTIASLIVPHFNSVTFLVIFQLTTTKKFNSYIKIKAFSIVVTEEMSGRRTFLKENTYCSPQSKKNLGNCSRDQLKTKIKYRWNKVVYEYVCVIGANFNIFW